MYDIINYKKRLVSIVLFSLIIFFNLTQCVSNKISEANAELNVRVVNNLTNKPFSNGSIELQQTKRTLLGFIKVFKVTETELNINGLAKIKIDSLSSYRIIITPKGKNISTWSNEFNANNINLKEVYEIRYLDDSEKKLLK